MNHSSRRLLAWVFVLLLVCWVVFAIARRRSASSEKDATNPDDVVSSERVNQFTALEAREQKMDQTVWAKEREAEECGRTFESLWDALNAATNKLELIAAFPVDE
ncbi:MAG TPA: hypothetical protein VN887_15715, partial [Candidatus Angelobacter sp.]|nr:hypothetical protein [Candidatus Angelobacter sp.]